MERSDFDVIIGKTEKVETKAGTLVIRELVMDDIAGLIEAFTLLFQSVDIAAVKGDVSNTELLQLLGKANLLSAVKKILAVVTDTDEKKFEKFPIKDAMKLLVAFLNVNDWEELKELFFALRRLLPKKADGAKSPSKTP